MPEFIRVTAVFGRGDTKSPASVIVNTDHISTVTRYEGETSTTLWLKNEGGVLQVYPFHVSETVNEIWVMLGPIVLELREPMDDQTREALLRNTSSHS